MEQFQAFMAQLQAFAERQQSLFGILFLAASVVLLAVLLLARFFPQTVKEVIRSLRVKAIVLACAMLLVSSVLLFT